MAEWPELADLKKRLDVDDDGGDDWTADLTKTLGAAIAYVKAEVGDWDEDTDQPNDNLAQAALHMAELMALRPQVAANSAPNDRTYKKLMYGQHRRFGIS